MKKILSILLATALFLAVLSTQAFTSMPDGLAKPKNTPHPDETETVENNDALTSGTPESKSGKPEKANPHAGKKYNFKGEVTSFSGTVLALTLKDGSNVSISVDDGTRIKFSGKKDAGSSIQPQDQVVVQAVQSGDQGYRAVRIHVLPGKPERVHRVGIVTAYTPGASITVESVQGADDPEDPEDKAAKSGSTTFQIAPDVKILPPGRADQLQVGARVTIISPRSASGETPVAKGIVVHPEPGQDDD